MHHAINLYVIVSYVYNIGAMFNIRVVVHCPVPT